VPVAAFIVVIALLVGNLILAWALFARSRSAVSGRLGAALTAEPVDLAIELAPGATTAAASGSGIRPETYDRVVRVVSYAFLASVALVVAAGGLWPTEAPAIYLLLLAGTVGLYVIHDVAPRSVSAGTLLLVEGIMAVAFFTLLIVLTGGALSPFFFGYFLIVATAAMVTGGAVSLILAAGITAAYLGAILLARSGQPFTTEQVVIVAVDVLALWLLTYLAAVVAGEQRRTRDAALRLSLHDPLTRLYNRTFLFAVIEREIARAQRTGRRFSLLMLDLDGLKPVNDRHGHYFGDLLLQAVADAVRQGIRVIDSPARYGGDEFIVLLPETDTDGAAVVAEKLRRSVAAIRLNAGTELLSTTASIGVVSFPEDGGSAEALTNRADQVMYAAKRAGRNRVSVEGQVVASAVAAADIEAPSGETRELPSLAVGPADHLAPTLASDEQRRRRSQDTSPTRAAAAARPVARPTVRHRARPQPPFPSMFSERYPSLDRRWQVAPGRSTAVPVATPSVAPMGPAIGAQGPTASPLRASAPPTTQARRFLVELAEDRTFERTMRRFLGDGGRGDTTIERP
jgi:diguanylate cyclase (GGDEF)-like protein